MDLSGYFLRIDNAIKTSENLLTMHTSTGQDPVAVPASASACIALERAPLYLADLAQLTAERTYKSGPHAGKKFRCVNLFLVDESGRSEPISFEGLSALFAPPAPASDEPPTK